MFSNWAKPAVSLCIVGLLILSGCSGGDDADTDSSETSQVSDSVAPSESDDIVETNPETPGDVVAEIDAGADGEVGLEEAIDSLDAETRYGVAAGQLDPEPTVEIDGSDIRMIFDGGSVANGLFDCIVGGVTSVEGETLTLVYPDGEKVCS